MDAILAAHFTSEGLCDSFGPTQAACYFSSISSPVDALEQYSLQMGPSTVRTSLSAIRADAERPVDSEPQN
jgi:hypothetical protein